MRFALASRGKTVYHIENGQKGRDVSMIEVDISNIWGEISLPELLGMEKTVFDAHMGISEAWMELPDEKELNRMLAVAEEIRESSDLLVVVGGNASRAAFELLRHKDALQVHFLEGSISARERQQLPALLEGKAISVCVESDSGLGDALMMGELKWLMERRYGTDEAHSRIHRDPWGLVTMAAAGLDLGAVIRGMENARQELGLRAYENPAWLYAAARTLLGRKGKTVEVLMGSEPGFEALGRWWQGQFATGEVVPMPVRMTGDMAPAGNQHSFETTLRFSHPEQQLPLGPEVLGVADLARFTGKTPDQVEQEIWDDLLERHTEQGIPVIAVDCGELTEETLGILFWFFRLSGALCRGISGGESAESAE